MTADLFAPDDGPWEEWLSDDSVLLHRFACETSPVLLAAIDTVLAQAPLQQLYTPGGKAMSVTTSCCGDAGWVSDRGGYRYSPIDPASGQPWPAMPPIMHELAIQAATRAGYPGFDPDACLINCYLPGARMSLHQDKDERDFSQPIVSVSLGLPATFLWGGMERSDKALRIYLEHGDVMVWGRADRLRFHGVMPVVNAPASQSLPACRFNLTFRMAM